MKMGQQETFNFLKRNKGIRWTIAELATELDITKNSMTRQVNKLIQCKFINSEKKEVYSGGYFIKREAMTVWV